ncbi:ATP-binding protein [Streptomyces bathyalis]|uniref:ATP-binding protein n=1 Tax=Streptomyces bathyalis TaxID=2710756 RepID=UPI001FE345C4|nr:ATP-binding protein [Streptomyces bathyalis]
MTVTLENPQRAVSDRIRARLQTALAERGIDLAQPPSVPEAGEPHPALEAAQRRIPYAYRDAVADHPGVAAWVKEITRNAVAPNALSLQPNWGGRGRREITHGPSLLLWGSTGTGKTHQAYGAIRALTAAGCGVRWHTTTAADLYGELRPGQAADSELVLRHITRVPLLLLDDLGAAKCSEWTEEITLRLLNWRCQNRLPTLITSNLPPVRTPGTDPKQPVLRDRVGDRVLSRLSGMCQPFEFDGPDRRFAATG